MYNNVGYMTLKIPEKDLEFLITITSPGDMLPKGVIMLCPPPHEKISMLPGYAENCYLDQGFIVASLYPQPYKNQNDIESMLVGYSALIDEIRKKYRYLPIIAMGTALSAVSVRQLAYEESERLGGVILIEPTLQPPSFMNMLWAKHLCFLRGNDFKSDILGNYDIPLFATMSYFKKAKELDSENSIDKYPKHMPTLIVNAKDDMLFEALDDAYVSGVEKALCENESSLVQTVIDFSCRVIDGVNDALSSDSFIYRGTNI